MVGGDDALAGRWLRSTNLAFENAQPIEAIKRVNGLLHACEYLDAHRARV
ncbi:MbcA/ParS/Xre antitoxin family protein [Immundisolibacter sp.]